MVLSVLVVGSQVILPAYFPISLWKRLEIDRVAWLLKVLYTGTFLLFFFVGERWDWPGYYLRYVFPIIFIDGEDMVRGELIHDPELGWIGKVDWSTQDVWLSYPPAVATRR